jgi:hypothetical protein
MSLQFFCSGSSKIQPAKQLHQYLTTGILDVGVLLFLWERKYEVRGKKYEVRSTRYGIQGAKYDTGTVENGSALFFRTSYLLLRTFNPRLVLSKGCVNFEEYTLCKNLRVHEENSMRYHFLRDRVVLPHSLFPNHCAAEAWPG